MIINKTRGYLFLKTFNSQYNETEVWFTDQNSKPLEIEASIKTRFHQMQFHCMKMRHSIEPRDRIYVKGCGFLSFAKNIGKILSNKYGQKLLDNVKNLQQMQ